MLRTRIGRLMAVVVASASIGGVLAAPASADPPEFLLEINCQALGTPVTVVIVGGAGIQQVIGEVAQSCDPGTMRVSVERL